MLEVYVKPWYQLTSYIAGLGFRNDLKVNLGNRHKCQLTTGKYGALSWKDSRSRYFASVPDLVHNWGN